MKFFILLLTLSLPALAEESSDAISATTAAPVKCEQDCARNVDSMDSAEGDKSLALNVDGIDAVIDPHSTRFKKTESEADSDSVSVNVNEAD